MMKLILFLTLTWTLCSTGGALQCHTCTDMQCSAVASFPCSSETMCVTASITATLSGSSVPQVFKACAPSSLCPATGAQTFSTNVGASSAVASVQCCNTDNCNGATLPFPGTQTSNSLQCLTCETSECNTPLQCKGVEDRCIQASVTQSGSTPSPLFGCASSNLCAAAASVATLPFMENVGNITSGPACCGTSLCNTVTTTTTAAPTTAPTTTVAPTTTAASSEASCIRLAMIHLLLGLFMVTLY